MAAYLTIGYSIYRQSMVHVGVNGKVYSVSAASEIGRVCADIRCE